MDEIQADNYRSSLRNKLVAEGFYLINVIEKYGSGFIRIRQALKNYPEVQFDVKEFQGGVMATFTQTQGASNGGVSGGVSGGVNGGVNALLAYIQVNPGKRANELAEVLDTPLRSVERWLKQLKETNKIEFRGAAKSGGYHYLDAGQ